MVHSSSARYKNLVRHISNWPVYFTRKFKKGFQPLNFVTKGNAVKFVVPSKALYLVFKEIFVTDFYSIDELVKDFPPKPIVLDIGGNAGYFNMMLFSKVKDASVYSYEPIASNYDLFKKNISFNPGLENKIRLENKAVTGTPTPYIELFTETDADNSVIASVYADFDQQNHFTVKVPAISLPEIIEQNNLSHIDLMKVDCEGSEYPVIYEAPDSIWHKTGKLVIEVHNLDEEKRNVRYLQTFLEQKNYKVYTEPAHSNCYKLLATKKS